MGLLTARSLASGGSRSEGSGARRGDGGLEDDNKDGGVSADLVSNWSNAGLEAEWELLTPGWAVFVGMAVLGTNGKVGWTPSSLY